MIRTLLQALQRAERPAPNYADPDSLRVIEVLEVRERWGRMLDYEAFAAHYDVNLQQARNLLNYCFDPTACWHELEC